ncbi:hypothetical protein GE21DRAFT_1016934 [Neurospora crassa]|nr:hypothetical protein GE21DRAFT_1016934 [Neurospora crassa]
MIIPAIPTDFLSSTNKLLAAFHCRLEIGVDGVRQSPHRHAQLVGGPGPRGRRAVCSAGLAKTALDDPNVQVRPLKEPHYPKTPPTSPVGWKLENLNRVELPMSSTGLWRPVGDLSRTTLVASLMGNRCRPKGPNELIPTCRYEVDLFHFLLSQAGALLVEGGVLLATRNVNIE